MENIVDRLLNPGVVITMVGAGLAYGWFLWALNIRPNLNLFMVAVAPGATFLIVIWSIRATQGVASATYVALMVDWLIFSCVGVAAVLVARRRRGVR
jgi:hypothetical protein